MVSIVDNNAAAGTQGKVVSRKADSQTNRPRQRSLSCESTPSKAVRFHFTEFQPQQPAAAATEPSENSVNSGEHTHPEQAATAAVPDHGQAETVVLSMVNVLGFRIRSKSSLYLMLVVLACVVLKFHYASKYVPSHEKQIQHSYIPSNKKTKSQLSSIPQEYYSPQSYTDTKTENAVAKAENNNSDENDESSSSTSGVTATESSESSESESSLLSYLTPEGAAFARDMNHDAGENVFVNLWDVNSPPVKLNGSETIESLLKRMRLAASGARAAAVRGDGAVGVTQQQQPPIKKKKRWGYSNKNAKVQAEVTELAGAKVGKKKKRGKAGAVTTPAHPAWPVIKYDDGEEVKNIGPLHAAELLLCRESVINFVINATDGKDECDGLKRAFDKTCSSDSTSEHQEEEKQRLQQQQQQAESAADAAATEKSNNQRHHYNRHRRATNTRTTFWDKMDYFSNVKIFCYQNYRLLNQLASHLFMSRPAFFFSEDAVVDSYLDAKLLVDHNLDHLAFKELEHQWKQEKEIERRKRQRRQLLEQKNHTAMQNKTAMQIKARKTQEDNEEEAETKEKEEEETNTEAGTEEEEEQKEEEEVAAEEEVKETLPPASLYKNATIKPPSKSIQLPTFSDHVSDKTLSETLLLHQGEQMIQAAQNKSLSNAEAIQDAHKSSKALADASAAVSAVLNDPTSIEARTCCASILNVYHENCSTDEEEQISDSRLFFVVFVILLCGMVKSLIRYFKILWLPEAAGCILVGVLSGYVLMYFPGHNLSFDGNWFLRIMVPPIIFEAALSIDKKSFNRHIVPIMIYAILGTLLATGLTAFIVHKGTYMLGDLCSTIPYVESLVFGALISSIDPIAVLSVLSNMGMTDTDTIYVVIFGESLLNDGVAIVLFHTLVHFLDETLLIDGEAVFAATVHFLIVAIGSLLIGVASGMMSTVYYWLFHGCQTPLVEVLMFFCWALLPYYVCDGIGWSGIVSAVATGFVMDIYVVGPKHEGHGGHSSALSSLHIDSFGMEESSDKANPSNSKMHLHLERKSSNSGDGPVGWRGICSPLGHLSDEARQHIGFVTEIISTTMETAIFAYLGLFLFSHRYHWNVFHTFVAIMACCISRGIMIPTLSFFANWITRIQQYKAACRQQGVAALRKTNANSNTPAGVVIDKKMQLVLWFAGLRGAMSFALVEHIPLYDSVSGEGSRHKPELKAMTSASILFTVFILGGYTYYMMDCLGIAPQNQSARKSSHSSHEMKSLLANAVNGSADDGDTASTSLSNNSDVTLKDADSISKAKNRAAFRRPRHASMNSEGSDNNMQSV